MFKAGDKVEVVSSSMSMFGSDQNKIRDGEVICLLHGANNGAEVVVCHKSFSVRSPEEYIFQAFTQEGTRPKDKNQRFVTIRKALEKCYMFLYKDTTRSEWLGIDAAKRIHSSYKDITTTILRGELDDGELINVEIVDASVLQ